MTSYENLKVKLFLIILVFIAISIRGMLKLQTNSYRKMNRRRAEYECGYEPFDFSSRQPFNIHFYFVGIVFVLFDVEIAILFPWAFNFWNISDYSFFLGIYINFFICIGILYEWVTKAIVWEDFSVSKVKKNGWKGDILKYLNDFLDNVPDVRILAESLACARVIVKAAEELFFEPLWKLLDPGFPSSDISNEKTKGLKENESFNIFDFFYNIDYSNFFENLMYFLYRDMHVCNSQESFDVIPVLPLLELYYTAKVFAINHGFFETWFRVYLWYENDYLVYWKPWVMLFFTHFAFRAMSHSNYNFTLETDASEIGFESCYVGYFVFLLKSLYTISDSYFYSPEKTISMFGILDTNLFLQQESINATSLFEKKYYSILCDFYKYSLIEFNNLFSCETFDDKVLINFNKTIDKKANILFTIKTLLFYFIFIYYFSKTLYSKKSND